jgi:hypothetical protein
MPVRSSEADHTANQSTFVLETKSNRMMKGRYWKGKKLKNTCCLMRVFWAVWKYTILTWSLTGCVRRDWMGVMAFEQGIRDESCQGGYVKLSLVSRNKAYYSNPDKRSWWVLRIFRDISYCRDASSRWKVKMVTICLSPKSAVHC